jgi:hypothetical protein
MQSKSLSTILVAFAVVFGVSYAIAYRRGAVSKPDGSDWLYVDHDLAGTRYSHLQQITTQNVSQIARACAYSFPDKEPSQTAPIVSAGTMYLTTAHHTVAVDGSDCHVIWTSKWSPRDYETMNTHRGAALAGGKIIRGTGDGFLLALDAKDGHTLWARQIANPKEGYFISMPPLVAAIWSISDRQALSGPRKVGLAHSESVMVSRRGDSTSCPMMASPAQTRGGQIQQRANMAEEISGLL